MTTVHEFGCEPIEQLGMRRPIALRPRVFQRSRQTVAEVEMPQTINKDTCGLRMVGRRKPSRKIESRRAFFGPNLLHEGGDAGIDDLALVVKPIATAQHADDARLHRLRNHCLSLALLDLAKQLELLL
jgi:hypothetical protein